MSCHGGGGGWSLDFNVLSRGGGGGGGWSLDFNVLSRGGGGWLVTGF